MKLLLLISYSIFSVTSFAQLTDAELKKMIDQSPNKKMIDQSLKYKLKTEKGAPVTQMFNRRESLEVNLPGFIEGRKVAAGTYRLSQDGMPCIVPDTDGIAAIPNVHPNVSVPFKTDIPNAYKEPLVPQLKVDIK